MSLQPAIRSAEVADVGALYALYHRVRPCWPLAEARVAALVANPAIISLVASGRRSEVFGYGTANGLPGGAVFTNVVVDPVHQGNGVGSLLWHALERRAVDLGTGAAGGFVQGDDERSISVVQHWGFHVVEPDVGGPSEDTYVLDLDNVGTALQVEDAPRGYDVQPLAELDSLSLADLLWPLYAVAVTDKPRWDDDEPDAGNLQERLDGAGLITAGSLVAFRDERPVGFTILTEAGPGTAHVDLTVVARAERGRGLATLLKRRSASWALEAGYERLITESRSDNGPIIAVNRKLGFRRVQLLRVTRPPGD